MPGGTLLSRCARLFGLGARALGSWMPGRGAADAARSSDYRVDISMLWGLFRYSVTGSMGVSPAGYRVEVVPVSLGMEPDASTGGLTARTDVSGWSSWARPDQPARFVFTADRRLESLEARLQFGSTIRMRFT